MGAGLPVRSGDPEASEVLEQALLARGETDRVTHGFHAYPAGLHPDAAAVLVRAFGGGPVLDPFCGGGTTLVEARVQGHQAIGRDVSPVARRVAFARTRSPEAAVVSRFRSLARSITEAARHATELPEAQILDAVGSWYADHTLRELQGLRVGIRDADADPVVRELLWVTLSSLLVKVSWRASDTSAKRVKHRRPAGTTAVLFHKKARELGRRLDAMRDAVPPGTPEADVGFGDARRVRGGPVQLVLTSPPYPSTYDYIPLQHLRHVWLPDDTPPLELEIGPRRDWRQGGKGARQRWIEDTHLWTKAAARTLAPGGALVVVIGDGLTPRGPIDTAGATEQAARAAGLTLQARASVERPDHARGTVRWEHAFLFRNG